MSWMTRFSTAVAAFATGRPILALTLSVATCVLLALPALGVRLDIDVARVLPDSPTVHRFKEMVEHFGASDQLFVVIEATAPGTPDDATRARARALSGRIAEHLDALRWSPGADAPAQPMVLQIDGRPEPGFITAVENALVANAWLFLDDAGVATVAKRLQPRMVERRLQLGGTPGGAPHLERRDPLGLWKDVYLPFWSGRGSGDTGPVRREGGYLVADAGRFHLLVLRPARSAQDRAFCTTLVDRCAELRETLATGPEAAGLAVHFTGGHFIAAADYRTAQSNAFSNLWQGALGVLVLFGLAYRSLRLVVFIAITLVPATLAALGITRLVLGPDLSLLAVSFATVLIGLGVDFIIHLYGAFGRHLALVGGPGDPRPRAAAAALVEMAPSILAGVLTTIVAFAVLGLSGFRGVRELGLVASVGLALMLAQLMVALPAFFARCGPRHLAHATALHGLGSLVARRTGWVAFGCALLLGWTAVELVRAGQLCRFDPQARNLRPAKDPVFDQQRALGTRLGIGLDRFQVLVSGADPEAVLETGCALAEAGIALAAPRTLVLSDALPPQLPKSIAVAGDTAGIDGGRIFDTSLGRLRAERVADNRLSGLSWVVGQTPQPGAKALAAGTPLIMRPLVSGGALPALAVAAPSRQRAVMDRLATEIDWTGLDALTAKLDDAGRARWAPFLADLAAMRARITARRTLALDEIAVGPLAAVVRSFHVRAGDVSHLVARFQADDLNGAGLRVDDLCAALGIVRDGGPWRIPGTTVAATGVPVLGDALARALIADFRVLGLWSAVAVFALLWLMMRGLRDALLAMAALALGTLVTFALMSVTGLAWNLINVVVLPLLFGIGIDANIYFLNALRRQRRDREGVAEALAEIAHPMVMTTATAMIGFGTQLFSPYRGLQSMAWVAILGMLACLAVALFVVPCLLLLTTHRASRAVEDGLAD